MSPPQGHSGSETQALLAEMQTDKVKKASKLHWQFMHMEASSGAAAEGQQKTPSKSVAEASTPVADLEPSAVTQHRPKMYRKW